MKAWQSFIASLLAIAALILPRPLFAAGGWDRNGFDDDDLTMLRRIDPALHATFLEGEQQLQQGELADAAASFKHVTQRAPGNALAARRSCQALTELGDRQGALHACEAALGAKPTPPSFRASVRAFMSGTPTPEELDVAAQLADAAQLHMDDQPWGLAAKSDIAERIGDEKMLQTLVLEMERIAPGHYETLRARKALNALRLPTWAWVAWLALAAAVLATALHAAIGALSGARARRRLLAGVSVALLLCLSLTTRPGLAADEAPPPAAWGTSQSGGLSKWPVNDADPTKSLPTPAQRDSNPLEFGYHMMDLADKADHAKQKGDYASVAKYYEAMAVAVPDRAIGYRKSCEAYEKIGELKRALHMCRGALAAEGLEVNDYTHFAKLVFGKPGALTPVDVEDLTQIAGHLKAEPGAVADGLQIQCQLAQRLDDVKRLEDCVAAVAKDNPSDPKLVIYQWGIAMKKEDYAQAQQLIAAARKSAFRPAGIELMERMTQEQSAPARRIARGLKRHAVAVCVAFALLLAVGFGIWFRRRLRLRLA